MVQTQIKKKQIVMAVISVGLLLASQMIGNIVLILAAIVFYLFTIVSAPNGYIIPLMLFYLPWSPILKISPDSISFVSIASILVFFKILFFKKEFSIKTNLIISFVGLLFVTLSSKMFHEYELSASYIMFFIMLVVFATINDLYSDEMNFEISVIFFSFGIILATVASLLCAENVNIQEYIVVFEYEYSGVTRHCGFYGDPNFYAAQIIPAIGTLLVIISRKKGKRLFSVMLIIALILCGLTSLSKSFLLCLVLIFAIWLLSLVVTKPSMFLVALFSLVTLLLIVLSTGMLSDVIEQYIIRFSGATDSSSLTTSRSDLWKEYINFLWDNPLETLFGQGFTSVFNGVHKGSHNTIIQLIYQFGLLGTVFLSLWFASFKKSQEKPKFFLVVLLLVSCFSMWMGLDMLFFDDFFLIIMLFFLGLNSCNKETSNPSFKNVGDSVLH